MIRNIRSKKENQIKEIEKNAETRMAVHTHTHTHTLYCHLENKKTELQNEKYNWKFCNCKFEIKKLNIKNKDRTILKYVEIRI